MQVSPGTRYGVAGLKQRSGEENDRAYERKKSSSQELLEEITC